MMKYKNKILMLLLLLSVMTFSLFTFLIFKNRVENKNKEMDDVNNVISQEAKLGFEDNMDRAIYALEQEGDPNKTLAIIKEVQIENKEELSSDHRYQAKLDMFVARALHAINKRIEAVEVYKHIALDKDADPYFRAYAIQMISEDVFENTEEFSAGHIFNDERFAEYYIKGDMHATVNKLNRWSSEYENVIVPDFYMADYLMEDLLDMNKKGVVKITESELLETESAFLEHMRKASDMALKQDQSPKRWTKDRLVMAKLYRARIHHKLSKYERNITKVKRNSEEVAKLFDEALGYATHPANSNEKDRYEYMVRLYYAIFLNDNYEQNKDKIKELLAPLYPLELGDYGIMVFLNKEGNYAGSPYHKKEIADLAKNDAEFKNLLIRAGWKNEDFK